MIFRRQLSEIVRDQRPRLGTTDQRFAFFARLLFNFRILQKQFCQHDGANMLRPAARRQHFQNRFRRGMLHQSERETDTLQTGVGNLIVRFPRPSKFSQLQNLGQHQRNLIDQPQDVIRCHFGLRFLVTDDEMDNAIWRGDEEAIEILA